MTTAPDAAPAEPDSVAVTVTAAVDWYDAVTALMETVGVAAVIVSVSGVEVALVKFESAAIVALMAFDPTWSVVVVQVAVSIIAFATVGTDVQLAIAVADPPFKESTNDTFPVGISPLLGMIVAVGVTELPTGDMLAELVRKIDKALCITVKVLFPSPERLGLAPAATTPSPSPTTTAAPAATMAALAPGDSTLEWLTTQSQS